MAIINANGLGTNDMYDAFRGLAIKSVTPTQITFGNDFATLTVTGTDFTYTNNAITGGTVTAITETLVSYPGTQTWTGLNTSAVTVYNALVAGDRNGFLSPFFGGDDVFNYTEAVSFRPVAFRSFGGNDTVNFGSSSFGSKIEEIDGGDGFDTLNLTKGFDDASFSGVRNFEVINLGAGYDYTLPLDIDLLGHAPIVINGAALGPANDFNLYTPAGSLKLDVRFTLIGGAGNDFLMGGTGTDIFQGSAGSDTVNYDNNMGGVSVDLNITTIQSIGGGWGSDILVSIENIIGTTNTDTLIGNEADNILATGNGPPNFYSIGNDLLDGRGGFDVALFTGETSAQYQITRTSVGNYSVYYYTTGQTVTLRNMEAIAFEDEFKILVGTNRQPNDFDGDKRGDLLLQYNDGNLAIWLTDKFSFAGAGLVGSPGVAWHARDTADYDNDGKADILMQHDDSSIAVWLVNDTSFAGGAQIGVTPGPAWKVKASGDFDGDGKADIIMQHDDSRIAVWKVRDLSFAGGDLVGTAPGTAWKVKDAGDFDGDGKSDMVMQRDSGEIAIWKLDGLVFAGAGIAGSPGAAWQVKAAADFNGDGKADLLMQHDDSSVAVWLMNGTSMAGAGLVATPGAAWHVKGASDYTGDGKADIVLQHDSGEIAVWQMSGVNRIDAGTVGNPGNLWSLVGPG